MEKEKQLMVLNGNMNKKLINMRKILTTLMLLLTVAFLSWGQDIKPISPLFKNLQSPSFSFMIGGNPWIYKGSLFNPNPWTELAGWTNVKDTLTNYWNKTEITSEDTTRWGNGDAIPLIYKNGIYKDSDTIKLGGVLTEDTDINVNDKYLSVYGNDKGLYINKNKSEIYVENDSTSIYMGLDEKYAYINNDSYDSDIGNLGSRINLFRDTIFITSARAIPNNSQHHLIISNDKHEDFFYKYHGSEFEVKRGTVQDTTGIKYVNIPTTYFQDSTLVPKYYVDGLVGGTQTLSTNGSAGNISISSGNTITLNVNDHTNRTALDNVSGVNTGDQTLSSLGGQPQLNGTGFVKASGTTISYDNSTYEPAFSKNTAFNKNFGTTTGTVLEGRTFGTAANNNTGDFIFASPASAQSANIKLFNATGDNYISISTFSSNYGLKIWNEYATASSFIDNLSDLVSSNIYLRTRTTSLTPITNLALLGDGSSEFYSTVNSTGYLKNSTPLLLDWLKSGSAPTTTQVLVGGGTTSSPVGIAGTEGQVLKIDGGLPKFMNESGGIADAPTDGLYYLRKDNAWDQTNAVTRSFSAYSLTLPSSRIIDELSGAMRIRNASYTNASFNSDGTTNFLYQLNGTIASFTSTITAANFILNSDKRLKFDIKPIRGVDLSRKIEFVSYVMKSDSNRTRFGVIAQDVEKVAPEFVYTDNNGVKSVDYIGILVMKVEALQRRVSELESEMINAKRKMKRHEK